MQGLNRKMNGSESFYIVAKSTPDPKDSTQQRWDRKFRSERWASANDPRSEEEERVSKHDAKGLS
jgi:hypothetical protein